MTVICIIAVFVFTAGSSPFEDFEDVIALGLVCIRYVVPIVQLILWFYHGRHKQHNNDEENSVIFSRFGIRSIQEETPRSQVEDNSNNVAPSLPDTAAAAIAISPVSPGRGQTDTKNNNNVNTNNSHTAANANHINNGSKIHRESKERRRKARRLRRHRAAPRATVLGTMAQHPQQLGETDTDTDTDSGADSERRRLHAPPVVPQHVPLMQHPDGLSDSDDGSRKGDMLQRVLVSHLHATERHREASAMDVRDALGYHSPKAGIVQSPFIVGKQMSTF